MNGKKRHPVASEYVKEYRANRTALARDLYTYFNHTVFKNKLLPDLEMEFSFQQWHTSGQTVVNTFKGKERFSKIYLSVHHLESPQRLRDILIHEMCHVATWLINCDLDVQDHGPVWIKWTEIAQTIHPYITIQRYDHYITQTNHLYICNRCEFDTGERNPLPEHTTCYKCCAGILQRIEIYDPDLTIALNNLRISRPELQSVYT